MDELFNLSIITGIKKILLNHIYFVTNIVGYTTLSTNVEGEVNEKKNSSFTLNSPLSSTMTRNEKDNNKKAKTKEEQTTENIQDG